MPQATLNTHLRVPTALLDMDRVRADLRVFNRAYEKKASMGYAMGPSDVAYIDLWDTDGPFTILPRGYRVPWRGAPPVVEDRRPKWPIVGGIVFRGVLRDHQVEAIDALSDAGDSDKALVLACGKGKTITALYWMADRGKKTIIIVDRDFLISQWTQAIAKVLQPMELGLIQGDVHTVGEQVTIASIQTLRDLDYGPEFYDQFGLVIVDEAHMLGAPLAARVVPMFPGERLLLTATPDRRDGLENVFLMHAGGPKPCHVDLTRTTSSHWNFLELPDLVEDEKPFYRRQRGHKNPLFVRVKYESALALNEQFNRQILDQVAKAYNAGRSILVLGSRGGHLSDLNDVARAAGLDSSLVIGRVKGEERDDAFKHRIIFATWQIAGRALDVDALDTLLLLYPSDDPGFLRQAVGRVEQRDTEKERKSVVVCFTHAQFPSLVRKAEEMSRVVKQIDPGATIKSVKAPWLT